MTLPIKVPFLPMEALSVAKIPEGDNWQYEPKWDGFRCLAFRDGDDVQLQSKAGQPLERYFPDLVDQVLALGAKRFVLDGEIVVPVDGDLSFDDLLMRIHPAASRITRLASETPASFLAFDLLVTERGSLLTEDPLAARRQKLEEFAERYFRPAARMKLSPATTEIGVVNKWFENVGGGLDGIIAKELDKPYCSGERKGMVKVKQLRTVDCVVGGFRYASKGKVVGSLLLGLYDEDGLLHHIGFWSSIRNEDRKALTAKVEKLIRKPGFTGQGPWRAQPLEHGAFSRVAAAGSEARSRGSVRPFYRRPVPARHEIHALAARQGTAPVHDGPARGGAVLTPGPAGREVSSRPGRRTAHSCASCPTYFTQPTSSRIARTEEIHSR